MVALWWGFSDLEEGSLLSLFFANAPDVIRGHAILFLERSIRDERALAPEIAERLRHLWEIRVAAAGRASATRQTEELQSYGPWAASEWFDLDWRLEMLKRTLSLTHGKAKLSHLMCEALVKASDSNPYRALECLFLLVKGDDEGILSDSRTIAPTILQNGFRSSDPATRDLAQEVGNFLAERGFHQGTRPPL
jgi:hypothetical protein